MSAFKPGQRVALAKSRLETGTVDHVITPPPVEQEVYIKWDDGRGNGPVRVSRLVPLDPAPTFAELVERAGPMPTGMLAVGDPAPPAPVQASAAGGLTAEQLVVACRNIGFDLTCGACACVFYTGYGDYPHDEGCKTHPLAAPPAPGEVVVRLTREEAEAFAVIGAEGFWPVFQRIREEVRAALAALGEG